VIRLLLIAAVLASGCAGRDTSERPAELVPIQTTLEVRRVWNNRVGGSSERLRLQLRPATDGARIYAGAYDGRVAAFELETGRREWSIRTRTPLSSGPGYANGRLVFGTTDGHLLALDAGTGEELWRRPVGSEVIAPPAVTANIIVLRTVDGRLRGFSASSGDTLWSVEQSAPVLTLRGNTPPVIAGNLVVSGFDNGRIGAYQLNNGESMWEIAVAAPTGRNELDRLVDISAGLQVVGSDVYAASYNGRAVGVDLDTGQPLWQQELSSFAGLGTDWNNVYVTDYVSAVLALDRRNGAVLWRQEALRLRDLTAPARFRNAIVVGDYQGWVHFLDPADGRFLARARVGSDRVTDAALVVGDYMFVQTENGNVAAFTIVDEQPVDGETG
jgi:outer membrane protein assembly factor BamB